MTVPFLLNGEKLVLPRDACDILSSDQFTFSIGAACPILTDNVLVPCLAQYHGATCSLRHFTDAEWDVIESGNFTVADGDEFRVPGVAIYTVSADHTTVSADFVALDINQLRLLRRSRTYPLPLLALRELGQQTGDLSLFQLKTSMPSGFLTFDDDIQVSKTPIVVKTIRHVSFASGDVRLTLMDSFGVCLTSVPYQDAEATIASQLYFDTDETHPSRSDYLTGEPDKQFIWHFMPTVTSPIGQGPFCLDVDHSMLDERTLDVTVVSDTIMYGRPVPTDESARYIRISSESLATAEWKLRVWYVRATNGSELRISYDFSMTEQSYVNGSFVVCCLGRVDGRSVISLISFDPEGYTECQPFDRNLVVSRLVDVASSTGDSPTQDDEGGSMDLPSEESDYDVNGQWQATPSTFEERVTRLPLLGKIMCFTLLLVACLALVKLFSRILKSKKR